MAKDAQRSTVGTGGGCGHEATWAHGSYHPGLRLPAGLECRISALEGRLRRSPQPAQPMPQAEPRAGQRRRGRSHGPIWSRATLAAWCLLSAQGCSASRPIPASRGELRTFTGQSFAKLGAIPGWERGSSPSTEAHFAASASTAQPWSGYARWPARAPASSKGSRERSAVPGLSAPCAFPTGDRIHPPSTSLGPYDFLGPPRTS